MGKETKDVNLEGLKADGIEAVSDDRTAPEG